MWAPLISVVPPCILPATQWNLKQVFTCTVPQSAHKHLLFPSYSLKMGATLPSKYWQIPTKMHDITFQKNKLFSAVTVWKSLKISYIWSSILHFLNSCASGYYGSQSKNKALGYSFYKQVLNLLKPTGHVMHQQFNIQQLYVQATLYLCVLYLSENKQRLVPLTA